MHVPAASLATTARALAEVATYVPLSELIARHRQGKGTRGLVAVTFDDAYASVLTEASDLMRELSMPVTLFVISGAAETGAAFWWDRVDEVFQAAGPERWCQFETATGVPETFRGGDPASLERLASFRQWILGQFRGRWPLALDEPLAQLEAEAGHRTAQRALTFQELDALIGNPLVAVGAHTASHPVLPLLPDEQISEEIRVSYRNLRERYPRTVDALALPFGLYDQRTLRIAKEQGLELSLTLDATLIDDASVRPTLPRIGMTARHRSWQPVLCALGLWRSARLRRADADRVPEVPSAAAHFQQPGKRGATMIQSSVGASKTDALLSSAVPRPRRALLLLEDLGGGTGNHVCRIAERWRALGWQAVLATQTEPMVGRLPAGVEIRLIRSGGRLDRFPLAQLRRFREIRRTVRALRPEVVHTYFFWSIIYGRILKLLGEIPVLVENREDMGFSWHGGEYALLRLTRGCPDRMICVAEAVRQVVIERERAAPARVIAIHNGIETSGIPTEDRANARRKFGFTDRQVVIGMVANLPRAVKGGSRLLDAIAPIVAEAPDARFLLVGLGADQATLAPELKARGIENCVVAAGYRSDVAACYAAMDVSVLTSSSEGLSITLLESMRFGLPTVVTRVGGNAELVVDGETGFVVPLHDPSAFAARVIELARDAQLRKRMGAAGRRRVEAHFSVEDVARRYLDVYRELQDHRATTVARGHELQRRVENSA